MSGLDARAISDEVLVANGPLVRIGDTDLAELKRLAAANKRRRVRICAHQDVSDRVHEMLIVHTPEAYVRPHKHPGKSESVHAIEGEADIVFFDDAGAVTDLVRLGPPGFGGTFFYRLDAAIFHTLLFRSDFFVMHEVTNGPFDRSETAFADWAPDESDAEAAAGFLRDLDSRLGSRT